ncbi:MAG: hypothetical protein ACPGSI_07360 [Pikeienuella sp.]
MINWLRPFLIIALTLFAAPRVMAADGEATVLCAADGTRQVILFDFETGAPVEQRIIFETCDHCLTPPIAPAPSRAALPQRRDADAGAARPPHVSGAHLVAIAASARGPPPVV